VRTALGLAVSCLSGRRGSFDSFVGTRREWVRVPTLRLREKTQYYLAARGAAPPSASKEGMMSSGSEVMVD